MSTPVPAVKAPRRTGHTEITGAVHAGIRGKHAIVIAGEAHERLDNRTGRIASFQRAVIHRPMRVVQQALVLPLGNTTREQVGIKTGLAHHRQHFAALRVNQHRRTAIITENAVNKILQLNVEAKINILPAHGRLLVHQADNIAVSVRLNLLITGHAAQTVFILLLNPGAADILQTAICLRIQRFQIFLADAVGVTNDMRSDLAIGIITLVIFLDRHPRQAVKLHGQAVIILLADRGFQYCRFIAPCLLVQAEKALTFFRQERQDFVHRIHCFAYIHRL